MGLDAPHAAVFEEHAIFRPQAHAAGQRLLENSFHRLPVRRMNFVEGVGPHQAGGIS